MSGLVRGKVECAINAGTAALNIDANNAYFSRCALMQACFKGLYDYFTSHPNYSLIALQYGNTTGPGFSSPGTGTNYYDTPGSFGHNAFFVVRANATTARPYDVYHLFQWAGVTAWAANSGWNQSPGAPSLCAGYLFPNNSGVYAGVGHAAAIGIGGTGGSALSTSNGNPWKGTQNANGTDTKPSTGPIWGAPAGGGTGVIIFPRSNDGATGAFKSQTQNLGTLFNCSTDGQLTRFHIVGDDDSWVLAWDWNDTSNYVLSYSGLYVPRANVTVPYPYCVIDSWNGCPLQYGDGTVYGDIVGISLNQGGIVSPLSGTCAQMQLDHYNVFTSDTNFWPDHCFNTLSFNMLDIPVGIYEPYPQQISGFLGQIDFFREMYNVPTNGVSSDYSRMFVGAPAIASSKYAIPWDKTTHTVPRSGNTRTGVTFVAPSLSTLT